MKTISYIRGKMQAIIDKEISKTQKEIAEFEKKIKDNESYYGGGGWCTQFTKAKERREAYLEELMAFNKNSGGSIVLTDEVRLYSYYCPSCMIKVMLSGGYGEKVDCPVCTRPIYKASDVEVMEIVRGSRMARVNGNHYIELTSNGMIKE